MEANNDDDITELGLEEIEAALGNTSGQSAGGTEQPQGEGGVMDSIQKGFSAGALKTITKGEVFVKEMLSKAGLVDKKDLRDTQSAYGKVRAKHDRDIAQSSNPTTGSVAQFVGSAAPYMAMPAKTGLQALAAGGTAGAIEDEENRARGAAIGAGAGLALNKAASWWRDKIPERIASKEKAFRDLGVKPTRSQVLNKGNKSIQEIVPDKPVSTYVEQYEGLLAKRTKEIGDETNRFFNKAMSGGVGDTAFDPVYSKAVYNKVRPELLRSTEKASRDFVKSMDEFFSGTQDLRAVKDMLRGNGWVGKGVNNLYAKAGNVAEAGKVTRNALEDSLRGQLKFLNPTAYDDYKAGLNSAMRKITQIENKDITKAVKSGDFDAIISQLSKPTGVKTLKNIERALGPDGRQILQSGILRRTFDKSFSTAGKFNEEAFISKLSAVRSNSGFKFGKQADTYINNMKIMMRAVAESPTPKFGGLGTIGDTVQAIKFGIGKLAESPAGMKLLTKAKFKSPKDVRARKMIDMILRTAVATGAVTGLGNEEDVPDNVNQLSLEEIEAALSEQQQ